MTVEKLFLTLITANKILMTANKISGNSYKISGNSRQKFVIQHS